MDTAPRVSTSFSLTKMELRVIEVIALADGLSRSKVVGEWAIMFQERIPDAIETITTNLWNDWDPDEITFDNFVTVAINFLKEKNVARSYIDSIIKELKVHYETSDTE